MFRVFEKDGVQVVCDTVSMDFLKGAVVEFEDSLMRSAFQVSNGFSMQHM
jgi:Fe-S cluster assembly iron-binding protein IscA